MELKLIKSNSIPNLKEQFDNSLSAQMGEGWQILLDVFIKNGYIYALLGQGSVQIDNLNSSQTLALLRTQMSLIKFNRDRLFSELPDFYLIEETEDVKEVIANPLLNGSIDYKGLTLYYQTLRANNNHKRFFGSDNIIRDDFKLIKLPFSDYNLKNLGDLVKYNLIVNSSISYLGLSRDNQNQVDGFLFMGEMETEFGSGSGSGSGCNGIGSLEQIYPNPNFHEKLFFYDQSNDNVFNFPLIPLINLFDNINQEDVVSFLVVVTNETLDTPTYNGTFSADGPLINLAALVSKNHLYSVKVVCHTNCQVVNTEFNFVLVETDSNDEFILLPQTVQDYGNNPPNINIGSMAVLSKLPGVSREISQVSDINVSGVDKILYSSLIDNGGGAVFVDITDITDVTDWQDGVLTFNAGTGFPAEDVQAIKLQFSDNNFLNYRYFTFYRISKLDFGF